ncbi:hypothetical protein AMTRI_Chr06g169860 [Amborella trichopoda]
MGSNSNSPSKSPLVLSDGFVIKPRDVCFTCFERGHWARDCPEKLKRKKVCNEGLRREDRHENPKREDSPVYWKRENGEMGPSNGEGSSLEVQCPCGGGPCPVSISKSRQNPGRKYYTCPMYQRCGFFQWCDVPSLPQSGSMLKFPICGCRAGECKIFTSKTDKNPGRQFFVCPIKKGQGACNFFLWLEDYEKGLPGSNMSPNKRPRDAISDAHCNATSSPIFEHSPSQISTNTSNAFSCDSGKYQSLCPMGAQLSSEILYPPIENLSIQETSYPLDCEKGLPRSKMSPNKRPRDAISVPYSDEETGTTPSPLSNQIPYHISMDTNNVFPPNFDKNLSPGSMGTQFFGEISYPLSEISYTLIEDLGSSEIRYPPIERLSIREEPVMAGKCDDCEGDGHWDMGSVREPSFRYLKCRKGWDWVCPLV